MFSGRYSAWNAGLLLWTEIRNAKATARRFARGFGPLVSQRARLRRQEASMNTVSQFRMTGDLFWLTICSNLCAQFSFFIFYTVLLYSIYFCKRAEDERIILLAFLHCCIATAPTTNTTDPLTIRLAMLFFTIADWPCSSSQTEAAIIFCWRSCASLSRFLLKIVGH